MRKTTTSLAIFCSVVAVITTSARCGKRGDPLPPLRPFPGAAEELTVRQIGNRIKLEWRAPTHNTDGTTEKLELAEVEVRRRIIDILALVEAQTQTIEPRELEEDREKEPKTEEPETPETPETMEAPETEPGEVAVAEPPLEEPASESPLVDDAPLLDEPEEPEEEEPQAPPVPVLQIPDFAPESRYITTLESTEPGERTWRLSRCQHPGGDPGYGLSE